MDLQLVDLGFGFSIELDEEQIDAKVGKNCETPPVVARRPRAASLGKRATVYIDPAYKEAKKNLVAYLKKTFKQDEINYPCLLCAEYGFRRGKTVTRPLHTVKPDRDNLDKALMDAFSEAGIWSDDRLNVAGFSSKVYSDGEPYITFMIVPVTERHVLQSE